MSVDLDPVSRGATSVDNITSAMKASGLPVTIDKFNDAVHAAAIIVVPRILGIPTQRISKLEKRIAAMSQMGSEANL